MATVDKTDPIAMDADTRTRLDEIKDKLGGLDDKQAALVDRYLSQNDMSLDKYATIIEHSKDLQATLMSKNTNYSEFSLIHNISFANLEELTQELKPIGGFSVDDYNNFGSVIGFDNAIRGNTIPSPQRLLTLLDGLNQFLYGDMQSFVKDAKDIRLLSSSFNKLNAFLTEQLQFIDGSTTHTNTSGIKDSAKAKIQTALVIEQFINHPRLEEALNKNIPEGDRDTAKKIMAAILDNQIIKMTNTNPNSINSINIDKLVDDEVQKLENDENHKALMIKAKKLTDEDKEKLIQAALLRTEDKNSRSLLDTTRKDITDPGKIDKDGLYETFRKDAARGNIGTIQGQAIPKENIDEIITKFKETVPLDFQPCVSYLAQQGGAIYFHVESVTNPSKVNLDTNYPNFQHEHL